MTKIERIYLGDALDVLKTMEDNSVDSVVTDPPYGLSKEPDINEVLTKWLAGEEYDHGHGGFMGKCFHPNTDILTLRGWVSVKDISKDDVVYTLNKDTNEIELSDVKNTFEYDFKGELISIAGRSVSQLVTPNHKVLVGNRKKDYKLQRADDRFNHRFYMKNQGDWIVPSTETISFAGRECNAADLAYFIGLYLGDGYYVDRKSYKEKQDFAGFSVKKERKARAIRGALSSLGFEFTENPPNESSEYYRFYLYDKDLLHELRDFGRSYDKQIPNYFFGESIEILRELYRGLMETDGTVQGVKSQEVFYTTSPRLADDFQRLCFLIGKSATKSITKKSGLRHKDLFVLSVINEGKDFYLEKDKNISRIPYDGKVYCIEAERNHILMTRFDGKPVWSGNSWDSFVPHPDIWREVYRVLKPGGHALVFAGTRTQDLMTISLRLAGFEVRDVIEWLYFSGMPKSYNVSKAFDRRAGAEREVVGKKYNKGRGRGNVYEGQWNHASDFDPITAPATDLARKWDGWGTSTKPSHEPVIVVSKPKTVEDIVDEKFKEVANCLTLFVKIAVKNSTLNLQDYVGELDFARNRVEPKNNIQDVLSEVTDISQLETLMENINWSTALSCLITLGDRLKNGNTFTTEMALNTIIELKTLKYFQSLNTLESTIKDATSRSGEHSNVETVADHLNEELSRLSEILTPHVPENATSKQEGKESSHRHEPIIMVRKPLHDGRKLTVVDCVEKYGTGAINIDASRIPTEETLNYSTSTAKGVTPFSTGVAIQHEQGRFPANCITLDSDQFYSKYFNVASAQEAQPNITPAELSKKASKKDRNSDWKGEEIAVGERNNDHPTVKPTDLMAWLVRLITPPNGIVLDPFAGSGSTLVAAKREGFGFIGVELTEEYIPIIEARTGIEAELGDREVNK